MEPSPETSYSPPSPSLLANALERNLPAELAPNVLAKMLLNSAEEVYQRFMAELRTVLVSPADVKAKRERQMRVLMSLR